MESLGAQLAARRRIVKGVCRCGAEFEGTVRKKHCSERCKQAAKYQRVKDSKMPPNELAE